MRLRKRYLLLAVVSVSVVVVIPAVASSPPLSVEAVNQTVNCPSSTYNNYPECHHWSNAQQTILAGEKVKFINPNTVSPYHGLKFTGGSPSCPGLTPAIEGPNGSLGEWKVECTFSKSGIYTFICTVHPSEMKGTITVTGTPKAETTHASGEKQTEATLNGSIEPEGNATEYEFKWGLSLSEHKTTLTGLGATDFTNHSVSAPLSGLAPGQTYHFELVAIYGVSKSVPGGPKEFTTKAVTAPTATTTAASGLKETEATLNGTVDPEGGAKAEYFFEWGVGGASSYEHKTPDGTLSADGAEHTVSAPLTGLTPGAEYHFRVVATNSTGGPIQGKDVKFTSSSPPKSEPLPEKPTTTTTPPTPTTRTTTPTTTTRVIEPPPSSPLVGGPSLRSSQRGSSVRGSLDVSQSGAGGRLEVDLLAKSASLAKARRPGSKPVQVGRLVRASILAGNVSFSVALSARAKSALRRHHKLALTVRITFMPIHGATTTIMRSITLRA